MSENLFKLWTTQFSTNLELRLQQLGSMLRGTVKTGFHVGKQASPINQVGAIVASAPAGRFAPKNRTDADFTRRWVFPVDKEIDQLIDSFDELRTIVDPKSIYNENAANAIGRAWDDALIAAFFGTAQVGTDAGGLSGETFNTAATSAGGFQVADTFGSPAGASGLNVPKLIEARRVLRHFHNDLDSDPPYIAFSSQQEADLLNNVEVISREYNERPVLMDGKITKFLGFNVIVTERLGYVGTDRACPIWVKSGMYLGTWQDLYNRVSIRNDLSSEPFDLYTKSSFGASRLQPGKVIQVLCADSTGADITP